MQETIKIRVTEQGLLIPKNLLEGMDEVEIRKRDQTILIVPAAQDDPIFRLGKDPIVSDVEDASDNHDRYLYKP